MKESLYQKPLKLAPKVTKNQEIAITTHKLLMVAYFVLAILDIVQLNLGSFMGIQKIVCSSSKS